jgi:hypothetical protein
MTTRAEKANEAAAKWYARQAELRAERLERERAKEAAKD